MLKQHGIEIIVANDDVDILKGTQVDYKESLMGGGFTIDNPNAILSCGCGTSFRTAKKVEHLQIVNKCALLGNLRRRAIFMFVNRN